MYYFRGERYFYLIVDNKKLYIEIFYNPKRIGSYYKLNLFFDDNEEIFSRNYFDQDKLIKNLNRFLKIFHK
jgi:hypothetical protein